MLGCLHSRLGKFIQVKIFRHVAINHHIKPVCFITKIRKISGHDFLNSGYNTIVSQLCNFSCNTPVSLPNSHSAGQHKLGYPPPSQPKWLSYFCSVLVVYKFVNFSCRQIFFTSYFISSFEIFWFGRKITWIEKVQVFRSLYVLLFPDDHSNECEKYFHRSSISNRRKT